MGIYNSFRQSMFLHEQQVESRKEELGARATMEGELWSMYLEFGEILKEPGCQA
jgi:hypothetical protein